MTYTVTTHNMFRKLPVWKVKRDFKKSSQGVVTVYSEAQNFRKQLINWCIRSNRGLFYDQNDVGNPISWDTKRCALLDKCTWTFVVNNKNYLGPARGFSAVGLRIYASNRKVLVISVHPENGYAKPENKTPWNDKADDYKDRITADYWLKVLAFVAQQMVEGNWDDIIIAGDFNARMNNKVQWHYPGRMLDNITRPSLTAGSIDHVITTVLSKSKVVGIVKIKGYTDHPILKAVLS